MEEETLYETREGRYRGGHKVLGLTVLMGIVMIWLYRLIHMPRVGEKGRWVWFGIFMAELWFSFYWVITQSVRWLVTYRHPFKQTLFHRYGDKLPGVDIFVCTADPILELPTIVINTVLSAMSYNYPPDKLSIYLSDDGGSELTFYALLEASRFCKHWIPFCKKFMVEPRSPEAYFSRHHGDTHPVQEWLSIKKLYEEMKSRIESAFEMRKVPEEIRAQHKGFSEWNHKITKKDHQTIVQIIIDGRDRTLMDDEGCQLPNLVYMSREKRPGYPHHFKAGAMNALIRVSSEISNAPFILNLDCDMYANDPDTILEILCFFMDEKKGDGIAFVQFPQHYENLTKNDIYGNVSTVINEIELAGLDGYGAALYCGTGCLHRRQSVSGMKYTNDLKGQYKNMEARNNVAKTVNELEQASKVLADCSYEKDTQWGKAMGLIYGCPVEDIVTGLAIQCRGWKSIYYNPKKRAFLGVAPTTLDVALIQYKRWSEGMFQIFFSKYCPFIYGHGKIKFGAQMGYCVYLLWAPISLPMLYYVIVPPLCLLHNISLFPAVTSRWFLPFAYVFIAKNCCSIVKALSCGSTLKAWWNLQRMLLIRRTTSFLFAFVDTIKKQLGLSETKFTITSKVAAEDVSKRYEQEIMEFGSSTIMFTIISTVAMLNLFGFVMGMKKVFMDFDFAALDKLVMQIILSWLIVMVNIPVYEALFIRSDKGRIPFSVMLKSLALASLAYLLPLY